MSKIILAHPYSAALYAYFSDEIGGDSSHTRVARSHSYYRTLYGNGYRRNLELALTFLLLYDDVSVAPADNHWPISRLNPGDRKHVAELGLHSDWDDFSSGDYLYRKAYIAELADVPTVQAVLRDKLRLPRHAWSLAIEYALYEEGLSARTRVPILCSPGRRTLISALVQAQKPSLHPQFVLPGSLAFVEQNIRVAGLGLAPKSLEHLMDAKPAKAVRTYGRALVTAVNDASSDQIVTRRTVAAAALEALESEATNELFVGLLRWGGALLRFAQVPVAPVATGLAAYLMESYGTQPNWCEFKGSIDCAVSRSEAIRRFQSVVEEPDA